MSLRSNPGKEHQTCVGQVIDRMKRDGFTILKADYGKYDPAPTINTKRPDAYGAKESGFMLPTVYKAIGEAEYYDDFSSEHTQEQMRALTDWAKKQIPNAAMYLGVIYSPQALREAGQSSAIVLAEAAAAQARKGLLEYLIRSGWNVLEYRP